jgi:hypothetical protein
MSNRWAGKPADLSGDGGRLPVCAQDANLHLARQRAVAAFPILEPGEGSDLWLSLVSADGSKVSVLMGAGELVALAADLLAHARVRCGRQNWPRAG